MAIPEKNKTYVVLPALFLLLVVGFIGLLIDNHGINRELAELKTQLAAATQPKGEEGPPEAVQKLLRDNYITQCKLKRSLEFYTVKDGKVAPRELLGQDRVECVTEAFAIDIINGGSEVRAAAEASSKARTELFRKAFDSCMASKPKDSTEGLNELNCIVAAHKKTLSIAY